MRAETLRLRDRDVRFWRGGEGPPLVLLQGGMADAAFHWAPVWDLLATRFEVIAPDWPGFGGSQALAQETWPAMLAWLAAFQDTAIGRPVALAGNSFGGTVARLYAAAYPQRVSALVLINGGGLAPAATAEALKALPEAALDLAGRSAFSREAMARMVANEALLTQPWLAAAAANGAILRILRNSFAGPPPLEESPAAPMLVLWGEADRHTPPDMGRAIAATIPGAQFQLISSAGHLPQLEAPERVAEAIGDFLAAAPFAKDGP